MRAFCAATLVLFTVASASCGRLGYDEVAGGDAPWRYRQLVAVTPDAVGAGALVGFPVYVDLGDMGARFHSEVRADGADIRVTDESGELLPREVVWIDTVAGRGELYFRAPTLAADEETSFFVYFGDPDLEEPAPGDPSVATLVWDETVIAAWHLEERPDFDDGCGLDRACNAASREHDGVLSENLESTAQVPGLLGGSVSFDGSQDAIDMPSLMNSGFPQDAGTVSILFRFDCDGATTANTDQLFDSYTRERRHFFARCSPDIPGTNMQFAAQTGEGVDSYEFARSFSIGSEEWRVLSFSYDTRSDAVAVYRDGELMGEGSLSPTWAPDQQLFILGRLGSGSPVGLIDEARLAGVRRSAEWVGAESRNLLTPRAFYRIGEVETPGP